MKYSTRNRVRTRVLSEAALLTNMPRTPAARQRCQQKVQHALTQRRHGQS
jgi:hypothetical protein